MRRLASLASLAPIASAGLLAACSGDSGGPTSHEFGPFEIAPGEEIIDLCVQITLGNADYLHVNSVELTTGAGFHHSNWFFVPEDVFPGDDGTYRCNERGFNEPVAAILGGVLFAQSTQAPHEIQQFPAGVVVDVPPRSKLVTQIHLLNASEAPITIRPNIKLAPIPSGDVRTVLAGIAFQDEALGLPPNMASRFTVDCDLAPAHNGLLERDPDFKLYYALAHYHELGTGLTIEAVRPDGSATEVFSTTTRVGDTLGGMIEPQFDMTGYTRLRFSCSYFNPRPETVGWGFGDQEMCVFLAFSDSTHNWAGGVFGDQEPGNPVQVGNEMQFSNPCQVFANDARR